MRTFSISGALLIAAAASLVGCSAEGGNDSDAWDGSQEIAQEEAPLTLAEIEVGYGKVVFTQAGQNPDGSASVSVAEITANDLGSTPFNRLVGLGSHTLLELFLAIAPEQEAPRALLESHEFEIGQLDRESNEVIVPEFDRDAPVEKITQACRVATTPPYGMCRYYSTTSEKDSSWATSLNLGSSSFYTNGPVHQGLCNDSSQYITAQMKRKFSNQTSLSTYAQYSVSPGQKVTAFTQFHWDPQARYRITGTPLIPFQSADFSLRSGKLSANTTLCPGTPPWL